MLLQIHDELVFEAPDAEIAAAGRLVREAMTTALDLDVPLKVDLAAGPELARRPAPRGAGPLKPKVTGHGAIPRRKIGPVLVDCRCEESRNGV